jgi:hypothetical protein
LKRDKGNMKNVDCVINREREREREREERKKENENT